jgi:hypothetical protein
VTKWALGHLKNPIDVLCDRFHRARVVRADQHIRGQPNANVHRCASRLLQLHARDARHLPRHIALVVATLVVATVAAKVGVAAEVVDDSAAPAVQPKRLGHWVGARLLNAGLPYGGGL